MATTPNTNAKTQGNFDFESYNALIAGKPAGLLVFLVQDMLQSVEWQMNRFKNPRIEEVESILQEVKELRAGMKQDAADRAKAPTTAA